MAPSEAAPVACYRLVLAKSGREFKIPEDQTILATLIDADIGVSGCTSETLILDI